MQSEHVCKGWTPGSGRENGSKGPKKTNFALSQFFDNRPRI